VVFTDKNSTAPYTIPQGSAILSASGLLFYTTQAQYVIPNGVYTIPAVQGQVLPAYSGIYNNFISIQVAGVDLSTLTVSISGTSIPRAPFAGTAINTAFPPPLGQGTQVTPTNGYFAVYYNGTLYIKIYPGASVPTFVGQPYSVSLAKCDGPAGSIPQNSLVSFTSAILDGNSHTVTYTVTNPAFTGGLGAPLRSEILANFLYWLFTKNNVSSISDYARWFRMYPGVYDVSVSGDYEDFVATGVLSVTGKVRVAPVMFQSGSTAGQQATTPQVQAMELALSQVRDIGITSYLPYGITYHILTVRYISVQNEALFQATVSSLLNSYYDVNYAYANAFSLFTDIDMITLTNNFPYSMSPLGLELLYQFYLKTTITATGSSGIINFYSSKLVLGGMTAVFTGTASPPGIGFIQTYSEIYVPLNPNVYNIVDSTGTNVVGQHDYVNDVLTITFPTNWTGTLELFGTPRNKTNFTSGSRYSIRQLQTPAIPSPLPSGTTAAVVNKILFLKYTP